MNEFEKRLIRLINTAERKYLGVKTGSLKKNWVMFKIIEYDDKADIDEISSMIDLFVSLSKVKHLYSSTS